MNEKIKVYKLELLVLGLNSNSIEDVIGDLENSDHFITVKNIEEREIEWSDDHPLNIYDTQDQAYLDFV